MTTYRKPVPGVEVSTKDLARITGYSVMHVGRLTREGMPKASLGVYNLEHVVKWLLSRRESQAAMSAQETKRQLMLEQIEERRLENMRRRGEMIPVEDVQHTLNAAAVAVATQLDGMAPRVAHELSALSGVPPAVVQEIIFREARAIRTSVASSWDSYSVTLETSSDYRQPASATDG
jgi:phage terminase Nu1 subunit (DNA packaging protein)